MGSSNSKGSSSTSTEATTIRAVLRRVLRGARTSTSRNLLTGGLGEPPTAQSQTIVASTAAAATPNPNHFETLLASSRDLLTGGLGGSPTAQSQTIVASTAAATTPNPNCFEPLLETLLVWSRNLLTGGLGGPPTAQSQMIVASAADDDAPNPYFDVETLLASVESGAIAAVKGTWLVGLHKRGGRLSRRQALPPEAFWSAR
eukprot:jgi/Chrpa1/21428/Chrysochromulina_OHIO_Genome00025489-RA